MANVVTVPTARVEQKAAARTKDAVEIYGKGQTEVRALNGVSVEFASSRYTASRRAAKLNILRAIVTE